MLKINFYSKFALKYSIFLFFPTAASTLYSSRVAIMRESIPSNSLVGTLFPPNKPFLVGVPHTLGIVVHEHVHKSRDASS